MTVWNLQPRWFKRLRLFFGIVWREWEGRLSARDAWGISGRFYRRKP